MHLPSFDPLSSMQMFQSPFASFSYKIKVLDPANENYGKLRTSHWQTGFSQLVQPSRHPGPHGQAKIVYFQDFHIIRIVIRRRNLPLVHSVSSLMHWLRQVESLWGHSSMHWSKVASHRSVHIWLRSSTLNKTLLSSVLTSSFSIFAESCFAFTYGHSVKRS